MKLELSYPAKPYTITQAFGIFNPAYKQFGFDHHNGIDFLVDTDGKVVAMCEGEVYETGTNSGAGNYVRYKTNVKVEAEGITAYVGFMYMHAKEVLVKKGDKVMCGTPLMVADNTGFSTGPHTHISAYFIDEITGLKQPYGDIHSDYCFDFSKYYNGLYADNVKDIWAKLAKLKTLISNLLSNLKRDEKV